MQCPECGQQIVKQRMEEGYDMYICAGCGFTSRELPETEIKAVRQPFLRINPQIIRKLRYLDPF